MSACVVDEPGINPNWAESITCKTAGLGDMSITKPSVTLDRKHVRDIGLRCLFKPEIEEALGRGLDVSKFPSNRDFACEKRAV